MYLKISLPPRPAPGGAEPEVRPAEMERWLANLPLLNVAETSQHLLRQLIGLNRTTLEDRQRLRLLEAMRKPVQHITRELRKSYIGMPLPLPDKGRQVAAQVKLLATEMAYGYKLIVFNSTALQNIDSADRQMLALAIHRAIRYLTDILFLGYELYSPPPEGTWHEIHQLYRYAEMLNITETPLDDVLNESLPKVSAGCAYKTALLLDFSDPYHQPSRMLAQIYRYLNRYAPLAQLSPGITSLKAHCQFLINLDNDRAGAVNTEASPITTEVRYRLLNTTELARHIHQQLTQIQAGHVPDADGLEKGFFSRIGQDILYRLIQAWGVNPKRIFTRIPCSKDCKAEIALGIGVINRCVNGEPFQPSTNEVGPQPRRTAIGGTTDPNGFRGRVLGQSSQPTSTWELADESAGGYALARSGAQPEPVRVGDLLARRSPIAHNSWEIGVVRWARSSGADSIELGVQRLSPLAAPAAVMPLDETEDRFTLALALPEIQAMQQPASLITPRGFFKPNRILYLDDGYRTRQVRAVKLVELSGVFERFLYEVTEA
jgi:hypothetical protein